METNNQNTVVTIFQNIDIFFSMLDNYADLSKTVVGFKISAYENVVSNYLEAKILDKNDRTRIINALSIKNMSECGLLNYIDDHRGQFSLQKWLVEGIQGMDSKRIRELGQPDLDVIFAQVKSHYDYFNSKGRAFDRGDEDFREHLAALNETLQDTLAKIDRNARALDGCSKRLSETLDRHDFSQLVPTEQVRKALGEIIKISERNILPTLRFLNEKSMAQDASAMYLVRRIRQSFEYTTFHSELENISAIEMKLLSYSEVIKEIRKRLYRYVEMDIQQRELYNNIESRFNELHTKVVARLDTKLTGKRIPADDPIFHPARALHGLKNWSLSSLTAPLMELPRTRDDSYVTEYIRDKLQSAEAMETKKRAPNKQKDSAKERLEKKQRVRRVKKAMTTFDGSKELQDIYSAVHLHLIESLRDYQLRDIYDAVHFAKKGRTIKQTLSKRVIIYKGQQLSYMAKRMEAKAHG